MDKEKEELKNLESAGRSHLKLLTALILSGAISFLVSEPYKLFFFSFTAVLAIVYGISHINIQFFQRCPRCKKRLNSISGSCNNCGLNINLGSKKGDGSEWFQ